MPTIEPIMPEGTITIQARTHRPSEMELKQASEILRQARPNQSQGQEETDQSQSTPKTEPTPNTGSEKDEKLLRARLVQERLKQQLAADRKKIDEERRELEIEKANSRRWQEAAELARQGRYIEAAEKSGITYDQMTQQLLSGGQVPPAKVAEQTSNEVFEKRFQQYKEEQEKKSREAQQKHYAESIKQVESEIKYLVDSSEDFPLVKQSESYQDVVRLIESEYHRTGRILPVKEAVQRWETEALDGLEELLKLDKVRSKVLKESPRPTEDRVPNTLSQRTTAPIPSPKGMTDAERRQRAIDVINGR